MGFFSDLYKFIFVLPFEKLNDNGYGYRVWRGVDHMDDIFSSEPWLTYRLAYVRYGKFELNNGSPHLEYLHNQRDFKQYDDVFLTYGLSHDETYENLDTGSIVYVPYKGRLRSARIVDIKYVRQNELPKPLTEIKSVQFEVYNYDEQEWFDWRKEDIKYRLNDAYKFKLDVPIYKEDVKAVKQGSELDSIFTDEDNELVVIDLETTGLDYKSNEIVEIGIVTYIKQEGKLTQKTRLSFLRKAAKITPDVERITGITQQLIDAQGVEDKEIIRQLYDKFSVYGKYILATYNASFDLNFLLRFLQKNGCRLWLSDYNFKPVFSAKLLDILTIYRDRANYPHKLKDALVHYGLNETNSHRAIDDAQAAYAVLLSMARQYDDIDSYFDIFGYLPQYDRNDVSFFVRQRPQGYYLNIPLYDTPKSSSEVRDEKYIKFEDDKARAAILSELQDDWRNRY